MEKKIRPFKKFITFFHQFANRSLTTGENTFRKLKYFGRCFRIRVLAVVSSIKKCMVEFAFNIWNTLFSQAFRFKFCITLCIGLLLISIRIEESVFVYAENIRSHLRVWIQHKEDFFIDWTMKMYEGVTLKATQKENNIVWLNIDNDTYKNKKWNNLFFTPRYQLIELIKFSVEQGAAIVIVDVNFSYTVGPNSMNLYKGDKEFREFLKTYPQKFGNKSKIILAGTFDYNETCRCVEKRKSFLDDVVSGDIYWGDPMFHVEEDGKIRRFQLWEPICLSKHGQAIPSIPLLIKILSNTEELIKKGCDLHHFSPDCLNIKPAGNWSDNDIRKRIIYRMPWKPEKKDPSIEYSAEPSEFLKVISVSKVYDCKTEDIKGKIVMIGGSHDDCQDFWKTPLDRMPGALVIINAIHSLLNFNENNERLCWLEKISIFILFVFIISFFFSRFDSFKAYIFSNIAILSILLLLMFFFRTRLFLLGPDVLYCFVIPWIIVNILNSMLYFKGFIFRSGDR